MDSCNDLADNLTTEDMDVTDNETGIPNTLSMFTQTQNSKTGKIFQEFFQLLQEVESSTEECIKDDWIEKLTSAPEKCCLALHENGCLRDLSYSLQIICNALLHFQNREEIYGSRLEDCRRFLKQLSENCVKSLESIDKWSSSNFETLSTFDQDISDEVIEVTLEIILTLTSFSSVGTRYSSKILITLLRAISSISVASDVIKKLCSEISTMMNSDKLKIANFLIKLLGSFIKEIFQKNLDISESMPDVVKLVYELHILKENDVPARTSLLRLLLSSRDLISDICEFQSHYLARENIQFILSVVELLTVISPTQRSNQSSDSIKLVINWLEINLRSPNVAKLIDEEILPKICHLITSMDGNEFNQIQEILFASTFHCSSYFLLEILADVYCFICKLAPEDVAKEYLDCFSKESMPLKVKVFILPAIARSVDPKLYTLQSNGSFICRFELINSKCRTKDLETEDCQFIQKFWKCVADGNLKKEEWETIIAICHRMKYTAHKLGNDITSTILGILRRILSKSLYSQAAALSALRNLKYVKGKTEEVVFQILKLYGKGESDDFIISILKNILERQDYELKLENYENNSTADFINAIEDNVESMKGMEVDVSVDEKERLRNIILSLQNLL